ncbi:MAG: hypothetical protein E7645_01300 [Ruminococcaceae bacterium]|nr:hypothetical protein [Oscillospiraceae bacterium]
MRSIKALALLMALVLLVGCFAACGQPNTENPTDEQQPTKAPEFQAVDPADAVEHSDFTSVYDMIGSKITIDMVTEKDGLAYVTYEGVEYELGMDFLSMAMVYNCTPAGAYTTAEAVYNQWWKLYVQRWNYLALAVPLYSNQYFDLYNAKIEGFVTTPYWGAADAIIASKVKEGFANSVILGSSTELSGAFRSSSWGKSSPGSSDLDIENLTSGFATVQTGPDGAMMWNMKALAEVPTSVINEDGTLTYTIKILQDMKFSDGSAINAKNYIASILANSTEVSVAAGGTGVSGLQLVGFDQFKAYVGDNESAEATKYFKGVQLIDDYTFAVTFQADYANYYYVQSYASFSPVPLALYLGENDIIVAEDKTCGLSDGFYAKTQKDGKDTYAMADVIVNNLKWDSALPYSGPYVVSNYDASALIATLTLNPYYPGDDARGKATIETITYVKMVSETQMDQFKTGQIDVLAGITGADDTKNALTLVDENPDKYAETHYDRAGYGFIGLRCDLGPASFTAVRQAILYTINRPEFAQTFTGGYGTVVHGPYYTGMASYQANKDTIDLNDYSYSSDEAIAVLEEGGWIYNADGSLYNAEQGGIRYKKLEGYELSKQNINYATTDNKYKTVKVDGAYYMPLAFNWYGTQPNDVTDQLITAWQTNPNATTNIGMYITYTSCDFTTGLYGEYLQIEAYGWDGVAKCCGINYATGFTSAIYDFSFNWTIDQDMYADYSYTYFMDEADFWENYQ